MNTNFVKILVVAVVAVVALGALGLGVAFAQNPTPNGPFTPGGMMGGYWNQQGGSFDMGAMHNWMISTGGMHTLVWDALTNALGLTSDELYTELNSGMTIAELAEAKGLDRATLVAKLESAHEAGLAQAVTDGVLTQEQADGMLSFMDGRYEWMIENMGSGTGYSMMGGYFSQQGGKGQFVPGGCHGNFAPPSSQD